MFPVVGVVLVSLALLLSHSMSFTVGECAIWSVWLPSVFDKLTTVGRREGKFKVKLMGVMGERAGEQGATEAEG